MSDLPLGILGLGLLFGLRHATEADHIAAVGAIVSERRGLLAAVRSGALWGAGHTLSILLAGLFVLGLDLAIPDRLARVLELVVAVMIIGLGGTALARALRSRPDVHSHVHVHGGTWHRHLHFHDGDDAHLPARAHDDAHHVHVVGRSGWKPLVVGLVHGLAGSAALTLLVLAQIRSLPVGLAYLAVFGVGSIGGMALTSLLIGLPFAATTARPALNRSIRIATSACSLAFGLFYAWSQMAASLGA
jgi:ABC-type nickel/cobalt efflux system permease component RcnA